jgi:folate-dependent phosphoribosylglycinamide formyltransferase PurN
MRLLFVGHDNPGSQYIFKSIRAAYPEATCALAIATGLYYKKSMIQSIWKMLREASFIFCVSRAVEMVIHRGESLSSFAKEQGVPIFATDDINSPKSLAKIREFGPDLIVSLYTMHIYKAEILSIPRLAAITAHPSILPDYRGLEVFFWAMANDESEIGVSVFKLTPRIDFGLVANDIRLPLRKPDGMRRVYKIITEAAAELLIKTISQIEDGTVVYREPQGKGRYFGMPTSDAVRRFWKLGHSLF